MARGGAPTGKWAALPPQLDTDKVDLREMEARLTVRRPDVPEVEIPLEQPEFVIGRHASEVDLALDDDLVSKQHAKLIMNERGYVTLEDLGSTNGIDFEGRRVKRLNLLDGDVFKIGRTELVFSAKMPRFKKWWSPPQDEPEASIMASVEVPTPSPIEPASRDEPIGWDPSAPEKPPDSDPPEDM